MKELPPGKDALAQTCRTSCSYDTPWNLGAPGCFQEGPKQSRAKSTGASILRASPVLGSLRGLLYLVGIWATLDYWDISSFPRKLLEESPEAVSEALDLIPQYICVMPDKACSHHLIGSWKHLQRRQDRDFFCLFVCPFYKWKFFKLICGESHTQLEAGMRLESRCLHNLFRFLLAPIFPAPPIPHKHQFPVSGYSGQSLCVPIPHSSHSAKNYSPGWQAEKEGWGRK